METIEYAILNGPGGFDMAIALIRGKPDGDEVDFRITHETDENHPADFPVFIIKCSISDVHMDPGRKSCNLEGMARYPKEMKGKLGGRECQFKAHYNIDSRTGTLVTIVFDPDEDLPR